MTDLAAIRERDAAVTEVGILSEQPAADRRALLAYIDGLAEAVERLPGLGLTMGGYDGQKNSNYIDRAAVLAILRGE
jgi:hypothetical protein